MPIEFFFAGFTIGGALLGAGITLILRSLIEGR